MCPSGKAFKHFFFLFVKFPLNSVNAAVHFSFTEALMRNQVDCAVLCRPTRSLLLRIGTSFLSGNFGELCEEDNTRTRMRSSCFLGFG